MWTLQLSSPVEEGEIDAVYDQAGDKGKKSVAFSGVETENATLTVSGKNGKDGSSLGSSTAYDLATILKKGGENVIENVVTELPVTVKGEKTGSISITLRLSFRPTHAELREAWYARLNVVSKEKNAAVDELRAFSAAQARSKASNSRSGSKAVPAGFLNRGDEKKELPKWQRLYEKYLGPSSLMQQLGPRLKNIVIFFGAVAYFHFQGQQLALPPPVV